MKIPSHIDPGVRNVISLGLSTGVGMAANVVYGISAARYLGPADFGRFSLVFAIGTLLANLTQGGGTSALVVLSAQRPSESGGLLVSGLLLQGAVGFLLVGASVLVTMLLARDPSMFLPACIFACGALASVLVAVPLAIFRGLDQMSWNFATSVSGLLTLFLFQAFKFQHLNFVWVLGAGAIAQATVAVIAIPLAVQRLGFGERGARRDALRGLSRYSLGLWGVAAVQMLHWRIVLIVVQLMLGSLGVGLYSAAARISEYLRTLPWLISSGVLPTLSRSANAEPVVFKQATRQILRFHLILAIALTIPLCGASRQIALLLYSRSYASIGPLIFIGSFAVVCVFLHWALLAPMIALSRHSTLLIIYSVAVVFEGVASYILIYRFGLVGAAIGALLGEVALTVLSFAACHKVLAGMSARDWAAITIPAAAALLTALWPVPDRMVWVKVFAALTIYVLGLLSTGALSPRSSLALLPSHIAPVEPDLVGERQ